MTRWLTLLLSVSCLLVADPESEDGKPASTVEAAEFHDMRAEEIRAYITRWALIEATLPGAKNLRSLSEEFRPLFTNPEVVAIKQDPLRKPAIRQWTDGSVEVWTKPLRDGSTAVGIFNQGSTRRKLSVGWRDIGSRRRRSRMTSGHEYTGRLCRLAFPWNSKDILSGFYGHGDEALSAWIL